MEIPSDTQLKAEEISQQLQAELQEMVMVFDQQVRDLGAQFGLRLSTEVSFLIDSDDQEGRT